MQGTRRNTKSVPEISEAKKANKKHNNTVWKENHKAMVGLQIKDLLALCWEGRTERLL